MDAHKHIFRVEKSLSISKVDLEKIMFDNFHRQIYEHYFNIWAAALAPKQKESFFMALEKRPELSDFIVRDVLLYIAENAIVANQEESVCLVFSATEKTMNDIFTYLTLFYLEQTNNNA